jgi:hypothetical protein
MSKANTSYKEYWAYKEVSKNWESKVTETEVTIYFDKKKNDIYGQFTLEYDDEAGFYFIYCDGELINDELDFYETYDEAVKSCFYYFNTRF